MKKTRIRRIIVREIKTTVINRDDAEKTAGDNESQICPVCHTPLHSKQIDAPEGKNLLEEKKHS